jgi:hypothetical protein
VSSSRVVVKGDYNPRPEAGKTPLVAGPPLPW